MCLCAGANAQFKNELKRQKLKGKVTMLTEYEYDASGDALKWKGITRYNDAGNPVFFCTLSATNDTLSKTTFTYNDSGIIKEERRYKADGSLNVRTTYQFDAKGNKIEEDNYDAGETLFMKVLSKFDGKGNRIVKDSYNEFGILFLKCNSKFDEDGLETESKEYDSHHGLKFSTSYDYGRHTDNAGNWLERTTYKNDEPSVITKREITY
jgi:hypothetical protein